MPILIGILLAITVAVFARWIGLDRDRAFYPTVMTIIASFYVLFSLIGGQAVLVVETGVCLGFIIVAMVGFKKTLWFVVAAMIAHGLFDIVHPHVVKNGGVPVWWPDFCCAYDLTAGVLLGLLLLRATPHPSTAK